MKIDLRPMKRARIEMLPLIDIVFLLLVFFIYAMLSMAVHRGLPVNLPESSTSGIEKDLTLSITVRADGTIYLDKEKTALRDVPASLKKRTGTVRDAGVLLFADRNLPYQTLFRVLDHVRMAGLTRISLQSEVDR